MARPTIEIDQGQLESLCRMKPTIKDAAAFFKCSEDTIERACKRFGASSFADFRNKSMVHTRHDLVRVAMRQAMTGNTVMLIFCLKNMCGWSDKVEQTNVDVTSKDVEELKKEAHDLVKDLQ